MCADVVGRPSRVGQFSSRAREAHGAMLGFDPAGELIGPFCSDPRIVGPARSIARSVRRSHLSQQRRRPRVGARSARSCGTRFWTGTGLNPGGGTFGPDCRYYLGLRSRRRILGWPPPLTAARNLFCPMVSSRSRAGSALPRGGWLYLASGIGPSGDGQDNRRVRSRRNGAHTSLVADPELSPFDLTVAPNGHRVVSSEHPFGAPDAVSSEYERLSGRLVRVFVPDSSLRFRRPRGLRYGPDPMVGSTGSGRITSWPSTLPRAGVSARR